MSQGLQSTYLCHQRTIIFSHSRNQTSTKTRNVQESGSSINGPKETNFAVERAKLFKYPGGRGTFRHDERNLVYSKRYPLIWLVSREG